MMLSKRVLVLDVEVRSLGYLVHEVYIEARGLSAFVELERRVGDVRSDLDLLGSSPPPPCSPPPPPQPVRTSATARTKPREDVLNHLVIVYPLTVSSFV